MNRKRSDLLSLAGRAEAVTSQPSASRTKENSSRLARKRSDPGSADVRSGLHLAGRPATRRFDRLML